MKIQARTKPKPHLCGARKIAENKILKSKSNENSKNPVIFEIPTHCILSGNAQLTTKDEVTAVSPFPLDENTRWTKEPFVFSPLSQNELITKNYV